MPSILVEEGTIARAVNEYVVTTPPLHFHVVCCPYCFEEAKRVKCGSNRCGSPAESKHTHFPGSSSFDCSHCGEHFYARFGTEDDEDA